jgi:NCS1 family nucleobase:cation symporter-1
MVVCVPTYTMASSMLDQGFSWQQAVWLVFLANCIVLVPMTLIGRVGPKYGIPFPVLARASFGVKGSNLPAVLRGLVGCGWFSINCYFGALALHGFLNILGFNLAGPAAGETISTSQFMCFLAFWLVHIWFIWHGPESIRKLEVIAAPLMVVASIVFVAVLMYRVPAGQLFNLPAKVVEGGPKTWAALTGLVGFWATLALNIPDFTRFARSQKDQTIGQAVGLPIPMALFSMVGVIGFSASAILYGKAELFPDALLTKMGSFASGIGLLVILLANLTTNVAANLLSPSYDFSQLAPSGELSHGRHDCRRPRPAVHALEAAGHFGRLPVHLAGRLRHLLGAIAGVLLVDYYLMRKTRLKVEDLYVRGGRYEYTNGWNMHAVAAFALGVLPCLPGYLAVSGVVDANSVGQIWKSIFDFGWFFSLAVASTYYYLTAKKGVEQAG